MRPARTLAALVLVAAAAAALLSPPADAATKKKKAKKKAAPVAEVPRPYDPFEVTFPSSDGVKLMATWKPAASGPSAPAVLLLHAFSRERRDVAEVADAFGARGFSTLALDLRGHGESVWKGKARVSLGASLQTSPNAFPRDVEAKYPGSDIHVIEIDPGVTDVAMNHMEMLPNTKIRTTNMDARQYLEMAPADEKYNLILGDAFNDFSVPFHLTTKEFTQLVADHMTDDGLYLANVIDSGDAPFLSAYTRTIGQVFPYVYVIPNVPSWRTNIRNTFVIVGSKRDLAPYAPRLGSDAQFLTPDEQAALLRDTNQIILTDDYVPTDNLLAPVFAASGF